MDTQWTSPLLLLSVSESHVKVMFCIYCPANTVSRDIRPVNRDREPLSSLLSTVCCLSIISQPTAAKTNTAKYLCTEQPGSVFLPVRDIFFGLICFVRRYPCDLIKASLGVLGPVISLHTSPSCVQTLASLGWC